VYSQVDLNVRHHGWNPLVGVQLMKKFAQVTGCDALLRMRGNFGGFLIWILQA
jgi:hypothetical protein